MRSKTFLGRKSLAKNRASLFRWGIPPDPQKTEGGKVAVSSYRDFQKFLKFSFDELLRSNLSDGGNSPTPPFGGTPPAAKTVRLPPMFYFFS